MSKKKYPDREFYGAIEKMTLPELEQFIETLCEDDTVNREKIDACLRRRKIMLNDIFECTPDNVERLFCMANLVKERVAMLHDKGNNLYGQMCKLWSDEKNQPFNDFNVEISLRICFNDEETSILHLDDDRSGSNYVRMAEILDDFYYDSFNQGNLIMSDTIDYQEGNNEKIFEFLEVDGRIDDWSEWSSDKFPELQDLPVVWEFHNLLYHGNYALQDIIRVNDVWSEAKVVWQHIAGQKIENHE